MIDVVDSMTELFDKLRFDEPLNYYNEFKIRLVGDVSRLSTKRIFSLKTKKSDLHFVRQDAFCSSLSQRKINFS